MFPSNDILSEINGRHVMPPSRVLVFAKALGRALTFDMGVELESRASLKVGVDSSWRLRLTESDERACTRKDAAQGQGAPLPVLQQVVSEDRASTTP